MKTKFMFLISFLLLVSAGKIHTQSNFVKTNEWLKDWFLIGPFTLTESMDNINHLPDFEKDFLKDFGGEYNFTFDKNKSINEKAKFLNGNC